MTTERIPTGEVEIRLRHWETASASRDLAADLLDARREIERLRAVVDEVIETNSKALCAYAIWRETGDSEAADTLEAWSSLLRRAALSGEET